MIVSQVFYNDITYSPKIRVIVRLSPSKLKQLKISSLIFKQINYLSLAACRRACKKGINLELSRFRQAADDIF